MLITHEYVFGVVLRSFNLVFHLARRLYFSLRKKFSKLVPLEIFVRASRSGIDLPFLFYVKRNHRCYLPSFSITTFDVFIGNEILTCMYVHICTYIYILMVFNRICPNPCYANPYM